MYIFDQTARTEEFRDDWWFAAAEFAGFGLDANTELCFLRGC